MNTKENKRVVIYFDMDGVLYPWNKKASFEDTLVPGYFNGPDKQENAIECVKKLVRFGYDVRILSIAYVEGNAKVEKQLWLQKNGLGNLPCILVPFGKNKKDYVDNSNCNILLDDFTKNLTTWVETPHHYGIKFFNGVNNEENYGSWHSFSVDYMMSSDELFVIISGIADKIKYID